MLEIHEILKKYRIIAVVGLSRDGTKYSNVVSRFMQGEGYRIIPINPIADELLGEKVYRSLVEVPGRVEIVDVFRPSEGALEITKQAVANRARVVWLQEGIVNDDARKYAEDNGVGFVQDRCIMKEYIKWKGEDTHGS
jgi:hypothetical protein